MSENNRSYNLRLTHCSNNDNNKNEINTKYISVSIQSVSLKILYINYVV